MIIWLDGTYGVGKTSIALQLEKVLHSEKVKLLISDSAYKEFTIRNPFAGGGAIPQNNKNFIIEFRNEIEKQLISKDSIIIVDMSLTQTEAKELLLDYFVNKGINIKHFILNASITTLKKRIEESENRDRELAYFYLKQNIDFLSKNYNKAIWINTDGKDIKEITEEIIKYI